MSDTTNTAESGAGAVAPATPKSDAEAALQTQATDTTTEPNAEQQAAAEKAEADKREAEGKRQNRTKQYIDRINAERAELARRVAELESRQSQHQPRAQQHQAQADTGPTLEQHGYDLNAYQQARDAWVLEQAEKRYRTTAEQQATQAREQATWQTYEQKAAEFADDHPDFFEVVGSIDPQYLPPHLQAAIAAHPNGPQIAYHIGNNEDDAFALASTQPHLAAAAVQRLAARLSAAPAATQSITPAPAAPAQPTKPITQAPPPVPQVGGRSATETPEHKLTDDQWFQRRQASHAARRARS